jgi:hypothetical protein
MAASLLCYAVGLAAVAAAPSMLVLAFGTMTLALGAGLTPLVRPHLIQTMFSRERGGYLNGRLAKHQQLARAAGPLGVAWLGSGVGYAAAFAMMAVAFTILALASQGVLGGTGRSGRPGSCGVAPGSGLIGSSSSLGWIRQALRDRRT